jgi:hypothetical protein
MKVLKWLFPIGVFLMVGGVIVIALADQFGIEDTPVWRSSETFLTALWLAGAPLTIIGSVAERTRLTVKPLRLRGMLCWVGSVVANVWFYASENYHGWPAALWVPGFVGLVAGVVLVSKFREKDRT